MAIRLDSAMRLEKLSYVVLGKKPEELPSGTLFIPYGPPSSQLMESDTAGSGMPLSKHMEVEIEKVVA